MKNSKKPDRVGRVFKSEDPVAKGGGLFAALAFFVCNVATQGGIILFDLHPVGILSFVFDGVVFVVALGAFQRDVSAAFTFFCHEGDSFTEGCVNPILNQARGESRGRALKYED